MAEPSEDDPVAIGNNPMPDGFEDGETVEERVADLEEQIQQLRSMIVQKNPYPNPFLAITNSTANTFTEAIVDNGTINSVACPPWRSGSYLDLDTTNATSNQSVMLQFIQKETYFIRISGQSNSTALFPVTVAADSGSAGTGTTPCTYTYAVTNLAGVTIGILVSPVMQRRAIGVTVQAQIGIAFFDDMGDLQLWWVDEVPSDAVRSCP